MKWVKLPTFFASLRGKITLGFVISIAAFMTIFSGMLLYAVRMYMIQEIDSDLISRTESIKNEIQSQYSVLDPLVIRNQFSTTDHFDFYHDNLYLWIIAPDTSVIYYSKNVINTPYTVKLKINGLMDVERFSTIPGLAFQARCFAFPIYKPQRDIDFYHGENLPVMGWVVMVATVENVNKFLNDLTRVLFGMMAICILIATAFALILSDYTLRPLTDIVASAQSITANQLGKRIKPLDTNDEVAQLVITLNHLLGRLESSFQQIKQFTADASHELLTPLTIIKGELELALAKDRDTDYYKSSLQNAFKQANHLILITQTLLKLSKGETEAGRLEIEVIDLQILFSQLFSQLEFVAKQKNIHLINDSTHLQSMVMSNENLLRTLFFNLIENAIKYSPENTQVTISGQIDKTFGFLTISITDEGPGIPDDEKSKIFDRFYRMEKSRAKVTGGSGLGLSLVSKIATLLKLQIRVVDNKPMGSVFQIFFAKDNLVL